MSAMTYANETADFMGASSLQLGSGEAGKNSLTVKWVPATITGTNLNPKTRDPVAYEITYISHLGGIANLNNKNYKGSDRVVIQTPSSLGSPPALDKDRDYTITGLNPDTNYYVQVRAIHAAYYKYVDVDPLYKKEMNTHFLKIKTLAAGALFDFNSSLVYLSNPAGENGLTNLDVSWIPASGEFNHYRVCFKQVASPLGPEPMEDFLQDVDLDAILNNNSVCLQKSSDTTNIRLGGVAGYAYYQVKVLACRNIACDSNNRIKSDLTQKRIITNTASFSGILGIQNPSDSTKLKEITLNFDSPVVDTGYLNQFKLYCYNSAMDTTPVEIALDHSSSTATGKNNCNGIKSLTSLPPTLNDYKSFENIILELPLINGNASYCFSLVPSIFSIYLNQENLSNAVVKCFTPEIKTPNILQFSGRIFAPSVIKVLLLLGTLQRPAFIPNMLSFTVKKRFPQTSLISPKLPVIIWMEKPITQNDLSIIQLIISTLQISVTLLRTSFRDEVTALEFLPISPMEVLNYSLNLI
jgi:hypothetical protein